MDRSLVQLIDIVRRASQPEPWSEEEKIPWDEWEFSRRMLAEHLSQVHDGASRRAERIAAQVEWIDATLLRRRPAAVLDLGCGPGLYTLALAELGHRCTGIDFGPASVAHAREQAAQAKLAVDIVLGDVRAVDYGGPYDLVMMIYGEFNVFRPADARRILHKACGTLAPEGMLLLEAHTWDAVRAMGQQAPQWRAKESGLFAATPHLVLDESIWHAQAQVAQSRHYVVDALTGDVQRYGQCVQAYTLDEYRALFASEHLTLARTYPSLGEHEADPDFVVLCANRKQDVV